MQCAGGVMHAWEYGDRLLGAEAGHGLGIVAADRAVELGLGLDVGAVDARRGLAAHVDGAGEVDRAREGELTDVLELEAARGGFVAGFGAGLAGVGELAVESVRPGCGTRRTRR